MSDADKLDDLDDKIAKARDSAEDAGIVEDPDEPTFHESGTVRPDLDDQQIAPPG